MVHGVAATPEPDLTEPEPERTLPVIVADYTAGKVDSAVQAGKHTVDYTTHKLHESADAVRHGLQYTNDALRHGLEHTNGVLGNGIGHSTSVSTHPAAPFTPATATAVVGAISAHEPRRAASAAAPHRLAANAVSSPSASSQQHAPPQRHSLLASMGDTLAEQSNNTPQPHHRSSPARTLEASHLRRATVDSPSVVNATASAVVDMPVVQEDRTPQHAAPDAGVSVSTASTAAPESEVAHQLEQQRETQLVLEMHVRQQRERLHSLEGELEEARAQAANATRLEEELVRVHTELKRERAAVTAPEPSDHRSLRSCLFDKEERIAQLETQVEELHCQQHASNEERTQLLAQLEQLRQQAGRSGESARSNGGAGSANAASHQAEEPTEEVVHRQQQETEGIVEESVAVDIQRQRGVSSSGLSSVEKKQAPKEEAEGEESIDEEGEEERIRKTDAESAKRLLQLECSLEKHLSAEHLGLVIRLVKSFENELRPAGMPAS
jgi:hypothetical protein